MRTSKELADRCRADGEFRLAARHWSGGLRLDFGDQVAAITIEDGEATAADPGPGDGVITLRAPAATWRQMLEADPPRFANDTVELGREAHEAIVGSTFTEMAGIGHFPMSENPEKFMTYLLPVLDKISADTVS